MRRIILLIIMVICSCPVCAQDTAAVAKVMQLVRQVQARIMTVPTSYYILYTYANEHTPATLLDSMRGTVEIDGTNYHSILDSTETIHNSKYNIVLFKEDKVMYLASSTPGEVGTNPMQQMLLFLDSAHNSTCSFSRNKSQVKVLISFPSGGTCKQLNITMDTAAQRLISMEYIIRTSLLMDEQSQEDVPDRYEEYAFVKATFIGYRELKKNLRLFDERNYFFKTGAEFKVAPAYEDYTIFVGSPGLQ